MKKHVVQWVPQRYLNKYRSLRHRTRLHRGTVPLISPDQDRLLRAISAAAGKFVEDRRVTTRRRLLFPTSYLHVPFNRVIDFVLAVALKVRGGEIVPVLCDGFHSFRCPVFPGVFTRNFEIECLEYCNGPGHILWEQILGYEAIRLGSYSTEQDTVVAADAVRGIDASNCQDYVFDGFNVGFQAAEVTANGNNLARVFADNALQHELRVHATNAVKMVLAYQRLVEEWRPDACIGSTPNHYQWASLNHVAAARGIPYYSHTKVDRKGAVHFARNYRTMLEVDGAWPTFRDQPISSDTWRRFDEAMQDNAAGRATHFRHYPPVGSENRNDLVKRLVPGKRTAYFPMNVPWDDAIHDRCFVGRDIIEFLYKVLAFFGRHPEYQLILKAHPMERYFANFESLPHSLANLLTARSEPLPENVVLLPPDSGISAFDIYPLVDVGIVYSSRSGCELAMHGIPVLLAADVHYRGKGFTIDLEDESHFERALVSALDNVESGDDRGKRSELARRYWLLFYFHGFVDLKLFHGGWDAPPDLLFESLEELLPGANAKLDYVCDAILSGRPLFDDNRWPPESL